MTIKKKKMTTEGRVEERGRAGKGGSWKMRREERKEKERISYPTKEGNFCCARAITGRNHSGTGVFVRMAGGLRGIDGGKGEDVSERWQDLARGMQEIRWDGLILVR